MKFYKILIAFVALLGVTGCGFEIVDTGHRGVQTRFGKVDETRGSMPEGFYTYNPLTSNIIELDVRTKRWDGETITYTNDVQQASIKFTVNYNLEAGAAYLIYRDVGVDWETKLIPQIVEAGLKDVVGRWEAADLIANRDKAGRQAFDGIREELAAKNVTVTNVELRDIEYTPDFEKSVEDKVVAIQRATEEKNRTVQINEQAMQKVITAKAQAESMRIRAKALTQNPALIDYEAVTKWDGKLPQYMLGETTPFLRVDPSSKR